MRGKFWWAGIGGLLLTGVLLFGASIALPDTSLARPLLETLQEQEPNDTWMQANPLPVPGIVEGAIATLADTDFYTITVSAGDELSAVLTDYTAALWLTLYDAQARYVMAQSTSANHRAELRWTAVDNLYYLRVTRVTTTTGYLLEVVQIAPTPSPTPTKTPTVTPTPQPPQPTPTSTPTWYKGYDAYEPNNNFDQAVLMAPGVAYDLNFIPWINWPEDYDFFRIRVKRGLIYTCETFDLDNGLDTTLTIYSEPDFNKQLMYNDDRERGDLSSRIAYYSTYTGYLYILVRPAQKLLPEEYARSGYKLRCAFSAPVVPTPRPTSVPQPTARPTQTAQPTTTATPIPGGTVQLGVRLETRPTPLPTEPTESRALLVLVYVDVNQDGVAQPDEAVAGLFVWAADARTGQEVARGYTDESGRAMLNVTGPVRLALPLLGLERYMDAEVTQLTVRLTSPNLPRRVP